MEPVYTVCTVYTMYYCNTRIKLTKSRAFCTLKIPFEIVLNAFSTVVVTQFNLYKSIYFCKSCHNSGQNKSPDMILSAFEVKFHEKKDGMLPKACRP